VVGEFNEAEYLRGMRLGNQISRVLGKLAEE